MTTYRYTDSTNSVVMVIDADGVSRQSGLASALVPAGASVSPALTPPEVFADVTPRQIRLAMSQAGVRAAVEAYIAGADQLTKDTYEFATTWTRSDPLLAAGLVALGKTPTDLDNLFRLAATL
jgi:hypothetical protein